MNIHLKFFDRVDVPEPPELHYWDTEIERWLPVNVEYCEYYDYCQLIKDPP